jgi:hypothetical protein
MAPKHPVRVANPVLCWLSILPDLGLDSPATTLTGQSTIKLNGRSWAQVTLDHAVEAALTGQHLSIGEIFKG